jgi:hypothetical protein
MANAWILNPVPLGAVTASATAAGYDPSYVALDQMGVVWKSGAVVNPYLSVDLGADMAIDTAMLMGCTAAAPSWNLEVRAAIGSQGPSFPGGSYAFTQALLAGSEMLPSGRGLGIWGPADAPALTRYLRFTVQQGDPAAATIGRLAVGKRVQLARNFSFGAGVGVRDLGSLDFSPLGVLLRRRGAKLRTVALTFSSVYKDEVEAAIQPLISLVGNTEPIGLILDPAPHVMRQRRSYFGFLVGDQGMIIRSAAAWEWKANLVSIV